MNRVPTAALIVGYLGLLPFVYGVELLFLAPGTLPTLGIVESSPAGGMRILTGFGAVILGFMGGSLWGFAAGPGRNPKLLELAASALPAAIAFVAMRPNPVRGCIWLAFGFVTLQAIDFWFQRRGIAPAWWLSLRLPLTAVVITCLLAGAIHG